MPPVVGQSSRLINVPNRNSWSAGQPVTSGPRVRPPGVDSLVFWPATFRLPVERTSGAVQPRGTERSPGMVA